MTAAHTHVHAGAACLYCCCYTAAPVAEFDEEEEDEDEDEIEYPCKSKRHAPEVDLGDSVPTSLSGYFLQEYLHHTVATDGDSCEQRQALRVMHRHSLRRSLSAHDLEQALAVDASRQHRCELEPHPLSPRLHVYAV